MSGGCSGTTRSSTQVDNSCLISLPQSPSLAKLADEDEMSAITATDAKNRFGQVLEMGRAEPVHVQKNGRDVAVVLSPEEFQRYQQAIQRGGVNPLIARLYEESHARWGKV